MQSGSILHFLGETAERRREIHPPLFLWKLFLSDATIARYMERKDIEHLAKLSRIEIGDTEADALAKDISSILTYVSDIESITGNAEREKKVGPLFNVMREDENPHPAGQFTEDLLNRAPKRDGQYVKVKKIIGEKS
jgi:aspartyl-tRNA(Asn)/glutamyl-tRNA(Gln) amidotransferase subunit C